MSHLVLLGDSILDNLPYTRPAPDTAAHLRTLLGETWTVHLLARDGARMADLRHQLDRLPATVTAAVLSIGGNDALGHIGLLQPRRTMSTEVFSALIDVADAFAAQYATVLGAVRARVPWLVACTIYEAPIEPPAAAHLARVPLGLLNDRIVRAAAARQADVLELRAVTTEPRDFVRQIEPSATGAERIARAIAAVLRAGQGGGVARLFAPA